MIWALRIRKDTPAPDAIIAAKMAPVPGLIRTEEKFSCGDGFSMNAYLSRPASSGKVPGLLFIYEIFGMNEEMKRLADELAVEGYAVMVPDLFHRGSWFSCVKKLMRELKTGAGQGIQDLIQAREWLSQRTYVDAERMGVMGLCMGGGFALLLAKSGLFRVSAPFYGQVPDQLDGVCPIVASYGGKDRRLLKDAERLKKELPRLGVPYDMKIYPSAGHGFMNRRPNPLVTLLARAGNVFYEPDAAADAKQRLIGFLKGHL
jgi:carboxymethylenebutenolidase